MAWLEFTEANLVQFTSSYELQQARTKGLNPPQDDPVPGVITSVVNKIRGAIRGAPPPFNALGAAGTIPDSLEIEAGQMVAYLCLARAHVASEDSRKQYEDALNVLRDIREGKIQVETPENPIEQTEAPAQGIWGSNEREAMETFGEFETTGSE